jgi:FtsH-binding integral membrane protein
VGVVSGRGKAWSLLLPWAGLMLAGIGWALEHQTGSNLSFSDCDANGPLATGLLGLAALILAVAGGLLSWRVWREKRSLEQGRSVVAMLSILVAILLIVAILLQTAAAFILPDCFA